jgi:signal peptidase II
VAELNEQQDISKSNFHRMFSSYYEGTTLPDFKTHIIFWSIAIVGLMLDLWSKSAVFAWLQRIQRGSVPIIDGFLNFIIAENPGAAFGIAQGKTFLFIIVSIIALAVIFIFFLLSGAEKRIMHIAIGLFAAGVCGNLFDRLFNNGLVRDFIDVIYFPGKHWPAFNLADSMLCTAVGLIIISSFLTGRFDQKHAQPQI